MKQVILDHRGKIQIKILNITVVNGERWYLSPSGIPIKLTGKQCHF